MNIFEYYDIPKLELQARLGQDKLEYKDLKPWMDTTNPLVLTQTVNTGVGFEIEVENVQRALDWTGIHERRWESKPDGSLRNNGHEFITKKGLRIHHLFTEIPWIIDEMVAKGYQTSDRTSIHVHINVQNLTIGQVNALLLLYVMFEEAFFRFTAEERRHNIFCTPIASSIITKPRDMSRMIDNTHKYSALNLHAARTLGSVEFRHLDTVFDAKHILTWIMFLGFLKRAAVHSTLQDIIEKILAIQFDSDYLRFINWVFHGFSPLLPWQPTDIDKAAADAKLFMFGET